MVLLSYPMWSDFFMSSLIVINGIFSTFSISYSDGQWYILLSSPLARHKVISVLSIYYHLMQSPNFHEYADRLVVDIPRGQSDDPKSWYRGPPGSFPKWLRSLKCTDWVENIWFFIILFLHLVAKYQLSLLLVLTICSSWRVSTRSQLTQWLTGCLCWSYFLILMTRHLPYPTGLT